MLGWISLHRKLQEHEIYADPYMLKLWIHCLLKASHKERNQLVGNQVVNLEVGQFITGRKALANEFNKGAKDTHIISESTLWRWLLLFEQLQMLNIKKTTKYSVVTVVNWCEYQGTEQQMNSKWTADEQQMNSSRTASGQQLNNKRTADEQQMNTNNNVNNFNNVNHDNNSNNDNNDNNDNNENNANERERPTDKDLKDSFPASSITNSVNREAVEETKEKTVVGRSVPSSDTSDQLKQVIKACEFTFGSVNQNDMDTLKRLIGMYKDHRLISAALNEMAQHEDISAKSVNDIPAHIAKWRSQGIHSYEQLIAKQEQTA
ncbi:hypothetical protein [Lysinibacillus sp. BNK-21]|uniref:hypothetical protein n=1 Tax=Lysinibacillus sp. BNK-21 TaxID=3376156 RepID=UPI003B42B689